MIRKRFTVNYRGFPGISYEMPGFYFKKRGGWNNKSKNCSHKQITYASGDVSSTDGYRKRCAMISPLTVHIFR